MFLTACAVLVMGSGVTLTIVGNHYTFSWGFFVCFWWLFKYSLYFFVASENEKRKEKNAHFRTAKTINLEMAQECTLLNIIWPFFITITFSFIHSSYVSISICSFLSSSPQSVSGLSCSRSSSELQPLCCKPREKILRRDWALKSRMSKESEEKRLSSLTTLEGRLWLWLRPPSLTPVAWRRCCRVSGNIVGAEGNDEWWSSGRSRLRENLPLRLRIPFLLLTASVRMVGLSSDAGREESCL